MVSAGTLTDHAIRYRTTARVAAALAQDVFIAPIESLVIPLPHQIRALSQARGRSYTAGPLRFLLAD